MNSDDLQNLKGTTKKDKTAQSKNKKKKPTSSEDD